MPTFLKKNSRYVVHEHKKSEEAWKEIASAKLDRLIINSQVPLQKARSSIVKPKTQNAGTSA